MNLTNLEAKVKLLAKDLDSLGQASRAQAIFNFIKTELSLKDHEQILDLVDINQVRNRAISLIATKPTSEVINGETVYKDPDIFRAMCYIEASIEFFRSKGYTNATLAFRQGKRDQRFCDHSSVEASPPANVTYSSLITYTCTKCGAKLKPVMWSEVKSE